MNAATSVRLREKLAALAPSLEGSSLYVLRTIDRAVDAMQAAERYIQAFAGILQLQAKEIRDAPVVVGECIDPGDALVDKLEISYQLFEDTLPKLLLIKSRIEKDRTVAEDQRELVILGYDRTLEAMAAYVEAAKDLRAAVISHDLAAEPAPLETFDSPDALLRSLHVTS